MTLLLQVSDTHFGTEQAPVVAALERLVAAQRPDVLLLSGDITQRATAAQFAAARAFVDRLQVPKVLAVPGNHDIPLFNLAQRLLQPYARYQRAFGSDLEPEFDSPSVLVLAVNTTRWWRHADGEVSTAQIDRVATRLAGATARQWKLVLLHQPVVVTREEDRKNLLHGHAQAVQRWRAAGADIVLGGHIHLPFLLPLPAPAPDGRRGQATGPVLWALQAGTAVSSRVRADAGNSVNLIRVADSGPRQAAVERWDHDAGLQQFTCVAQQALAGRPPA